MNKSFSNIPSSFESARLILRSYRAGDGPLYYRVSLKNRLHLTRYESGNVVMQISDEEDAENIVCELADDWASGKNLFIGVFNKQNGDFVAQVYVGLVNKDLPEYLIGCFVDKDYEGLGYMKEAFLATLEFIFGYLKAYRVSAECDDTNIRSIKLLESCGFSREGLIRENKLNADGSISGTAYYGLLRREYRAK